MNNLSSPINKPVVFGEVVFDCFEGGEQVLGGAPFNVAWHLHHFGVSPMLISALGGDEMGRQVQETMQQAGMDSSGIQLLNDRQTGHVNVKEVDGEPAYTIVNKVAFDFIDKQHLCAVEADSFLYHGTLAVRNDVSKQALDSLLERHDLHRFVDVNLRDPWWEKNEALSLLRYADYVKLNEDELNALASDPLHRDHPGQSGVLNLALANAFKQELEIVNLIITLGQNGAGLIDPAGEFYEVPAPPRSESFVDSVGAGDAFASVMIFAIIQQWDLSVALARAQEFASFIVTQRGAVCREPSIYSDFLSFWGHTR